LNCHGFVDTEQKEAEWQELLYCTVSNLDWL
jgi:hypothetical protein